MKNGGEKCCKFFVFIIFVIILNLTLVRQVFCYDTKIAHPGIAGLAVKLYNQNNSQKISAEQFNWIKKGAVEEDEPTRWLNHFYDPIYNRGLWFGEQHDSAKVWAKDYDKQTTFALGDNTWQRAINDYRKGSHELAFKELGHNIHLVSDMLVPAHTRDSIHAIPPDSYEEYVKKNWDKVSKNIKSEVFDKKNLEDIFDEAAKYSNGNFYSDKTIEDSKYDVRKIYNLEPHNFNGIVDFYVASTKNNNGEFINSHLIIGADWKDDKKLVNNSIILQDYASHLLPKAVGYSANTIKLFLAEAQKNEKQKLPFFRVGLSGLINNGVGKIIAVAENVYDYARSQTPDDQIIAGPIINNDLSNTIPTEKLIIPNVKSVVVSDKPIVQPNNKPLALLAPVKLPNFSTPDTTTNNPNKNTITPSPEYHYGSSGNNAPTNINQIVELIIDDKITTTATLIVSTTQIGVPTSTIEIPTFTIDETIDTTTIFVETTSTQYLTSSTLDVSTATTIVTATLPVLTVLTTSTINTSSSIIIVTTSSVVSSTTVDVATTTILVSPVTSTTSTIIIEPLPPAPDVVINEIAWAGTSAATDQDEYIELYNNTNQDINLFSATNTSKWWKLMIGDKEISIGKIINRIIPKNGYYLFERTDDRTVNEISADIIYSGALKNSGERLRLFDGSNQLVDEVNNSGGWFAGSTTTYSSMEKINSRLSGNTSTNWQTNQGPRFEGKVDGGGDDISLNGSPKQSNFGSIVLKSRQVEVNRTLKKSDYPYILTYYEIPVGKTLNVDPGVVIKTYYPDSKVDIKGNLNINGSDSNKVIITSGRDTNFEDEGNKAIIGSRSGNPQSKDWQGLLLYASSTASLSGLDLRYAGKAFRAPGANMWDSLVSQAVRSDSAILNINNSIFSDNGDTTIYLSKSNSTIKNTDFKNGQLAVENYDGSLELENINLNNFSNPNGPVYIKNIWPKMLQINFSNNVTNNIAIDQADITSDLVVTKDIPMTWQNITIQPAVTVDISAGTNIKMPEYANIFVKGTLNLNGAEDEPVDIRPVQLLENYYWGRIIFDGGKGIFKNANISGGRGSIGSDGYQGMITVNNGELELQNSQLLGSRAPGNALEITNSTVGVNNSTIGYIGSKPNFDHTDGIKINSGELMLNNTNLMNLDTGIYSGTLAPFPDLILNNMDSRNFMNVKLFWDPIIWYDGLSITP